MQWNSGKDYSTRVYQIQAWHKNFPDLLNVVVMVKTNLTTGRSAKVLLFSDDLALAYDKLIDDYRLRFQIEFNFRDAKQYWGLEDFMNIKESQVSNAANFSLFMGTFSQLLFPQIANLNSESMQDLKTTFRARKYTCRIINLLGLKSDGFLINDPIFQAAEIGGIHAQAAWFLAKVWSTYLCLNPNYTLVLFLDFEVHCVCLDGVAKSGKLLIDNASYRFKQSST